MRVYTCLCVVLLSAVVGCGQSTSPVTGTTLSEALVATTGEHVSFEITQSHYDALGEKNAQRLLRWLDQSYEAMAELTGSVPWYRRCTPTNPGPIRTGLMRLTS